VRKSPSTDLDRPVVAYLAVTAPGGMLTGEAAITDVLQRRGGLVEDRGGRRTVARFTKTSDAMSAALEVSRRLTD
jgi:hypothetical protein